MALRLASLIFWSKKQLSRLRFAIWPRVYPTARGFTSYRGQDILDVGPDGSITVSSPVGPAPIRPQVIVHSEFRSVRSQQLARRAAVFLFDHFDFATVPSQYWPLLEKNFDPGRALKAFLQAVGCDSELVRRRDPAELGKARDVIDLLVRSGDILQRLRPEVRRAVAQQLESGDYAKVHELAEVATHLQTALDYATRWTGKVVFATFADLLRTIQQMLDDPLNVSAVDAASAVTLVANYATVQKRFDQLTARYQSLTAALRDSWPSGWNGGPNEDVLRTGAEAFEHMENTMRFAADLDYEQLGEGNAFLGDHLSGLEALLAAALGGGAGGPGGPPPPPPPPDDMEDALRYFGFSKASPPKSRNQFRAAWLKKMRPLHPDMNPGRSDEEAALLKEKWNTCERHNSLLLDHFSWH